MTEGSFSCQNLGKCDYFLFPGRYCCTKERPFGVRAEFEAATLVIGISKDSAEKQAKFRDKYGLTCLLGADTEGTACEAFGVWVEKSMYGRKYMGIQRATFIVNADGRIGRIWPKVKIPGHAEEVLEHVQAGG